MKVIISFFFLLHNFCSIASTDLSAIYGPAYKYDKNSSHCEFGPLSPKEFNRQESIYNLLNLNLDPITQEQLRAMLNKPSEYSQRWGRKNLPEMVLDFSCYDPEDSDDEQ